MVVIDADGHVEESVQTFIHLEDEWYRRRPIIVEFAHDTVYAPWTASWLIDVKTYPNIMGKGGGRLGTPTTSDFAKAKPSSIPSQEITDVAARLSDLDKAGIDQQVVYPTLFLMTTTEDVRFEAALYRSYNTFMADACAKSGGRIKYAALVPIRDLEESVKELRRAKRLGASSIMLLGVAWDKNLGDKSLWPFYEEAASLDIPVCSHFGWGSPAITNVFNSWDRSAGFTSATLPVMIAFHSVMGSGVLEAIPNLRFAFLEVGSQWVPWVMHQLRRSGAARKDPADYFREGRVYVACEADEDINHLIAEIGEDGLVVASDFPHSDFSREDNIGTAIMGREDVPLRVREKILSTNPQRLYGLGSASIGGRGAETAATGAQTRG
ncbi:MAG: Amidohydrolase [Chloroflexi bacterium]|nr:Amidohydrolase [Chloroflexota bacterium]